MHKLQGWYKYHTYVYMYVVCMYVYTLYQNMWTRIVSVDRTGPFLLEGGGIVEYLASLEQTKSKHIFGNMSSGADLEASEATQLLDDGGATMSPTIQDEEIWQEMVQPWPATFERSISLLSSPMIDASEVDRLTKSPKPGNTPLAARQRIVREIQLKLLFHRRQLTRHSFDDSTLRPRKEQVSYHSRVTNPLTTNEKSTRRRFWTFKQRRIVLECRHLRKRS